MDMSPSAVWWWITAVELPALAGLFALILRHRRDADAAFERQRSRIDDIAARLRDSLAAHKLEVAKAYASVALLKDVEIRLTDHLLRIEAKLERTRESAAPGSPKS